MSIVRPRPQVLTIWRMLLAAGFLLPALLISFFLTGLVYGLAATLWFVLFLGIYLVYLPLLYKSLIFIMDEEALTLKRGVIYNNLYSIPLGRVQFTALTISPFARLFGLVTLRVVAPGARVSMPGLTLAEARAFAKEIAGYKEATDE